jgi:divalent metal cation (Fe/Co/Zn/Cd) transporter
MIWRFRLEQREPHRAERAERLAERIVGSVLLLLAAILAAGSSQAILTGSHPDPSLAALVIPAVGVTVLPGLALAKYRTARALGSGALRADSVLTGLAAALAAVSLVSLALVEMAGLTWADAVGGLVVAAVLGREGLASVRLSR